MKDSQYTISTNGSLVLPSTGTRAWVFQFSLIVAAVLLPAAAHLTGAPVRWLLPMHWPVILAALVYGWRGGMTVGALAPASNYLLTGYPLLLKAFPMTFELAIYGLVIGWLREKQAWNSFAAVTVGLIAGRVVFLSIILMTGANEIVFSQYIITAMIPGLIAGVIQVATMPSLARVWIKNK
ncbi:MAG: hypothetical protein P9X24_19675 [Candidatus Hatepunaea meridiana]|nr:hypothetical protein [Candidatus Hatepunaea meridiana]